MNIPTKTERSRFSRLCRTAVMVGLAAIMGGLTLGQAIADDGHHDDRDRWEHERMDRERWERRHRYVPPPVMVAPPPQVYYAPPPVVAAPPSGINIILPITIR